MWVNVLAFLLTHLLTGMSIIFNQDYVCITESGSFTTNSTYGKNLDHILDSLPDNVSKSGGFFTATAGQDSNKAYALGLCSGDLNPHDCYGLVKSAVRDLRDKCPDHKEAISWSGDPACIVRYANRPFFGILQLEPTTAGTITQDIGSNLPRFDTIWESLTDRLVRNASNGSFSRKYATGEAYFTVSQNINAQMQCTPDLSQEECDSCLRAAKSSFKECCHGKQGGYVQKPNCMFTFDLIPTITQDQKPEKNQNKSIWVPLGESSSAILGLALVSACCIFLWKRTNIQGDKEDSQEVQLLDLVIGSGNHENSSENVETSQEFPSIKLDILLAATTNFCDENKLGQGGFGPVYKGTLADGNEIAVKRLSRASSQGLLEFKNEVMLIAKLQHRNLVRLLGCCLGKNEKLLVYEFMPNRSLDLFLFDSSLATQLSWQKRFNIIKGTARGIMYLREDSHLRVIHRDLKASNVLLDHEMNPKISDFGMAKIFCGDQNEANTNRVVGTYGYMAPEYAMEGLFSVKSDVFSFEVILLEIISGKKNNGFHLSEHGESLLTFAWKLWSKGEGMELIDEHLARSSVPIEVLKCIKIGLLCVQVDPENRPTMSTVVAMLGSKAITLPRPTEIIFYVGHFVAEPFQLNSTDRICFVNEVTIFNISS
ncbi:hypothetical protein PVK06_020547 [Gossypium arboreum]|uniref:Cysteine-rich receptor-like protein kinase 10 n=1 Tax=Gossypium arboreum TaxID=29729 RepID=A0ABR0PMY0_GOSAR|nr:hypothetical protein PVK06_020547 [Gossypium arboreum]